MEGTEERAGREEGAGKKGECWSLHCLHSKHLAKTIMLHVVQRLCQDISSHILGTNEFQGDGPILYALPDVVISYLNVFH